MRTTPQMPTWLIFATEAQFRAAVLLTAQREPVLPDDDEQTLRHDAVQVRRSWTLPVDARYVVSLRVALNAVAVARHHSSARSVAV
jgi:hypothetical protein